MSSLSISSMQRPDASQMASRLFGKLDSKNQGYIEKSDLASAFSQLDSTSGTDSDSVDALFSTLDGDGDGKVTESEMTTSMKKLAEELDSQFNSMRMQGGMAGAQGMPPPPPPQSGQGEDSGFSKDELMTAQLEEIGSTDSKRSALISNVVSNFDEADADGDGKVTAQEAMAFDQKSSQSATSGTDASSLSASSESNSAQMLMKIMQLAQAYGLGGQQDDSTSSLLNAVG
ncbi:EF-hand domain-containing protein [Chitinilyticum aquatile]|uniref:EF-hand domain-containing protein n=1 Tax=Chitinilyticum aquatile TaxID=362520 RepID=UPI00041AEC8F|nr:EF-hand domain-containing protein [Chitinilyticum aquatile]